MVRFATAAALAVLFLAATANAITVIDFEGLSDLQPVAGTYAPEGATFQNATALTAGLSLNEIDFPPHSGMSVAYDDGGLMTVLFSSPVTDVGGWFDYTTMLTLSGYDSADVLAGQAMSSQPSLYGSNEYIGLASGTRISKLTILGDPAGSSFVLDDLQFTAVPEPLTLTGVILGAGSLTTYLRGRRFWAARESRKT